MEWLFSESALSVISELYLCDLWVISEWSMSVPKVFSDCALSVLFCAQSCPELHWSHNALVCQYLFCIFDLTVNNILEHLLHQCNALQLWIPKTAIRQFVRIPYFFLIIVHTFDCQYLFCIWIGAILPICRHAIANHIFQHHLCNAAPSKRDS